MTRLGSGKRGGDPYRQALARLGPVLLAVLAISAVLNVLMLTGSLYMLQVYDRVLTSNSVPTLLGLFAIVVVLYTFLGVFDGLRMRLLSRTALRLEQSCGVPAFRLWLGCAAGTETAPVRDLETVRAVLSGPTGAIFDLAFVPLFLAVLFLVHPALGWLTVAGAGITAVLALANRSLTAGPIARTTRLEAAERTFAEQGHRLHETLRAMRMERAVATRWEGLRIAALAAGQAGSDPSEMLASASRAFRMLLQSAILTLGAFLVIRGEMSGGMIIAASILSGRALAPVDQLIGQWRTLAKAQAAHRRLKAAFAAMPTGTVALDLPRPSGEIALRGVTVFAPGAADPEAPPILRDIRLDLAPGDGLGVIGRSASGKSTLARVLVGALEPDQGELRYDGATPDQWDPARLGRAIGYLPQQVEMLPGTVRDNITRFDPGIPDTAVIAAARQTGIHEMILRLPEGYGTELGGSGGPRLSGGQIQRLGLARAICGGPRIVVLDEPNSNLDPEGDEAVTATVAALRRFGATVVVMAHRPSAIAAVDRLLVLEKGEIRALGSKEAVLAEMAHWSAARPATPAAKPSPDAIPERLSEAGLESRPEPRPGMEPGPAASEGPPRPSGPRGRALRMVGPRHKRPSP